MDKEKILQAIKHTKNALNNTRGIFVICNNSKEKRIQNMVEKIDKEAYLETCLQALQNELERIENKPLTLEELQGELNKCVYQIPKIKRSQRKVIVKEIDFDYKELTIEFKENGDVWNSLSSFDNYEYHRIKPMEGEI